MAALQTNLMWVLYIVLISLGCNVETEEVQSSTTALPDHVKDLQNVSVYSLEEQLANADTVELIRETVFESNEDVYMAGYLGEVAVDDQDRVYIVSSIPGTVHVYVFEPNGEFITKFYREGRGPGESEAIGSIKIKDDKIYLLGSRLQKYLVYSISDFAFIRDAVLKRDSVSDKKLSLMRASDLYVDEQERVLMKFNNFALSDTLGQIYYYPVSESGQILPDEVFSQKKYDLNHYKQGDGDREFFGMRVRTLPFHRSSLFVISDSGYIYDAWTQDFLIKVFDSKVDYQRAIYHSYDNSVLNTETLDIHERMKETFDGIDVPDTWPALHQIRVDEEERLWVATIIDSDSTYQWYVLENNGELKAEFTFPGKRSESSPMFERQLPIIKNGYFYTRERNLSESIDRIVKYRIEFRGK
ncbi:6-bladed beta-propeller [Gracilimonas sp.]|uniref:6-bladed beta-propeller n=1 Tax=Gracilimonas sp. TaxID=1974203 RepID=UPI00287198DC|nr:BF3164 family lipoprotein [Gracilimonas sp.]